VEKHTIIYNADGKEIDCKEGFVVLDPKEYDSLLPIEYKHIAITTEVVNAVKIER
jgi:hypothetical protein